MNMAVKNSDKSKKIERLVFSAAFAALIFVATAVFPFPLPGGGYANLGDAFIIAAAFFIGPLGGFFAAAVGSAASDLFLGFAVYAPATFLIKGLMALVFALLCRSHLEKPVPKRLIRLVIAGVPAEAVMVVGYFLFECVLLGVPTAAADVAGNLVQAAVGLAVGVGTVLALSANRRVLKTVYRK